MRTLFRALLLTAAALLVPVVPFLFLGAPFEQRIEGWFRDAELSRSARFALIVAALSTDIFLPVPSSMVSTYGGGVLGTWPATAASWLGMTVGAFLGFALSRAFGPAFAARLAGASDLDRMARLADRFGPLALVLTRALPILAEACVLLMGATRLQWRRFVFPVMASNFVVSLSYAACGEYFQERNSLPIAVVASGTVPLLVALLARRRLSRLAQQRAVDEREA
ncbi:MAG: VTT domain-containing protein [Planctomycetaceae bacterium]